LPSGTPPRRLDCASPFRVDLDGPLVRAEWTCTSPAFPTPMRGYNVFTLNDAGQIARLEITVIDAPPMEH
jgi:hypothetical protein